MTKTKASSAELYNLDRPYTRDLWKRIQTIIDVHPDGVPGPVTASAIRIFQGEHNLAQDGYCGPATLATMGEGIFQISDAFLVFPDCKLSVDADGASDAYHPANVGIDYLGNAGSPGNWWGIATDAEGHPYIQGPDDPHTNYYISTTAYVRKGFPANDPERYFDSRTVAFVAMPSNQSDLLPSDSSFVKGESLTVTMGGAHIQALFADVSGAVLLEPNRRVNNKKETNLRRFGEGSIKLHKLLGNDPFVKRGDTWRAAVGIDSGVSMFLSQ